MPNKFHNALHGIFLSLGIFIPSFAHNPNYTNTVKTLIPQVWFMGYPLLCLKFVWRQLESAFFGAVTSVAALFDLERGKYNHQGILNLRQLKHTNLIQNVQKYNNYYLEYTMDIFIILIVLAVFIIINYKVAQKFEEIAFAKGHGKEAKAFILCFWLNIVGYMYVIALPNSKYDNLILTQNKSMINLLNELNDNIRNHNSE